MNQNRNAYKYHLERANEAMHRGDFLRARAASEKALLFPMPKDIEVLVHFNVAMFLMQQFRIYIRKAVGDVPKEEESERLSEVDCADVFPEALLKRAMAHFERAIEIDDSGVVAENFANYDKMRNECRQQNLTAGMRIFAREYSRESGYRFRPKRYEGEWMPKSGSFDRLVQQQLRVGEDKLQRREYDDAIAHFQQTILANPAHPLTVKAHLKLGDAYRKKGETQQAMGSYQKVLQLTDEVETSVQAYLGKALCYQRSGVLPDAIKTLKKALVLAPGHSEAQARLQQLQNQNEHCISGGTTNGDEKAKKKLEPSSDSGHRFGSVRFAHQRLRLMVKKQRKEEEQSALLGELNPRAMAIQRDVDENYWAQMRRPEQIERIAEQVADTILVLFLECGVPPGEPIDDEFDDESIRDYFEQLDDPIRQLINYGCFRALVFDVHSQLTDEMESEHKVKVLGGQVGCRPFPTGNPDFPTLRRKRATKALSIVKSALFNPQRYTRSDVLRPARAADSMTYAGRGANPAHTNVYPAPAAKNGTLQWKFPLEDAYSLCISDCIIYVGTTDGFDTPSATQPKGFLYALSTEKSRQERVIWRYQAGDEIKSTPCVVDGIVYFGSRDYTFYALDAKDGTLIWRFETEDRIHSSPTVFDGVVYFGSWDYIIYALDATNGQEIWRYRTEARVNSSPSVHNGIVYIGTMNGSRRKPVFYALSAEDGSLVFKLDTGKSFQDACVYDDKCFVSDHDTVYALEPQTGSMLWQRQLTPYLRSCAASEESLYVTNSEGIVYVHFVQRLLREPPLDAKNGSTLWTYQTDDRIVSTPCLCEDILYVTAQDSFLYAFSAKNGEIKWKYQTGKFILFPLTFP